MTSPICRDAVKVPKGLREAMFAAHAALVEKRAHVDRLTAARADVEASIAEDRAALDKAKAAYVAGFADAVQGPKGNPKAPQAARAEIAEIGGRIFAAEQTLPDFSASIFEAKADLRECHRAFTAARSRVADCFKLHCRDARANVADLIPFKTFIDRGEPLDLQAVLTLYMGIYFEAVMEQGRAFPDALNPSHFFTFIASFFRAPTANDVGAFREAFERLLWGDREPPPPVPIPREAPPDALAPSFDFSRISAG